MKTKLPVLKESMDVNDKKAVLAEWVDDFSEPIGEGLQRITSDIILEEESLDPESADLLVESIGKLTATRAADGGELLTDEFRKAHSLIEQKCLDIEDLVEKKHLTVLGENIAGNDIRNSHYLQLTSKIRTVCQQVILQDILCQPAAFTLADCFGVDTRDRCPDDMNTKICHQIPSVDDDCSECETPDQPATFMSPAMDFKCWELPDVCYRSIAWALNSDLDCSNATAAVQSLMQSSYDRMRAKQEEKDRIALMFGLPPCGSCGTSAISSEWMYDGYRIPLYHNSQSGCLWENDLYGLEYNPSTTAVKADGGCVCPDPEVFRKRLKMSFEDGYDWFSDDPVDCGDDTIQFLFADECIVSDFSQIFGGFTKSRCTDGPCDAKVEFNVGADPMFSNQYKYSKWIKKCLVDWFMSDSFQLQVVDASGNVIDVPKAPNEATACYRANNTYLMHKGPWSNNFRTLRINDFQRVLSGTNHCHYFDRGTRGAVRNFYGHKMYAQRPWLARRVFAWDAAVEIGS